MQTTAKVEIPKENITFRLDKATLDRLRFEAEEKGSSVNSVANAIFSTHYRWTVGAPKAGMIPIHKSTLAMLLDQVPDEELTNIAKLFADLRIKDMTLILKNNYNLAAFLDVLEAWMTVSSVSFDKRMIDGSYHYTISHDVGSKWSAFLSLVFRAVFDKMGVHNVTFDVTDGTILFGIPKIALYSKQNNLAAAKTALRRISKTPEYAKEIDAIGGTLHTGDLVPGFGKISGYLLFDDMSEGALWGDLIIRGSNYSVDPKDYFEFHLSL